MCVRVISTLYSYVGKITHLYGKSDVSICTEPPTFITRAMVEAPTCHTQSEGRRNGGGREGDMEGGR